MLKFVRAALVAICLIVVGGALPAAAQQATPAPAPAQQSTFALTADQIGAIAVGAVAGAILLDVMGGGMANLTGAVLGGIVGYWIYTQPAPGTAPQGS
jgi:hypothetical protein